MSRNSQILEGITPAMHGIEVAPWFAPIAAKRDGYNVMILDVFDRPTLIERLKADPREGSRDPELLEDVDFVGSATEIVGLVPEEMHGTLDYVISSHNFEHLPNPIKFLRGCETLLKPGGVISMAVPDRRGCFDYFRPNTIVGEWLEAFTEDRERPNLRQRFQTRANYSQWHNETESLPSFAVGAPLNEVHCEGELAPLWKWWQSNQESSEYFDTHCSVFTPASLELLLLEVGAIGLTRLRTERVLPLGAEFLIRLRKPEDGTALDITDLNERRTILMRRMVEEYAAQAGYPHESFQNIRRVRRMISHAPITKQLRNLSRKLRGKPPRYQ